VARKPHRPLGLVDQLQRSHRFTIGVLLSVLVLSLATSGYLILLSQPRLANYVQLAKEARDIHEAMLDQETGLRGWLATGDGAFLEPYEEGRENATEAVSGLLHDVRNSSDVTDRVLATLLARQQWQTWATEAAGRRFTYAQRADGTLTRFLLEGKALFDTYRARDLISTTAIRDRRTEALDRQKSALIAAFASYLLLLGASGAVNVRRRRHLQETVLSRSRTCTRPSAGCGAATSSPGRRRPRSPSSPRSGPLWASSPPSSTRRAPRRPSGRSGWRSWRTASRRSSGWAARSPAA
jgi:CHASE3 domain sensor protein